MAQSEQELRKKQAIERLIQIQAQRALDRARPQTLTTIVDGEIVRILRQAVFPGDGNKVGLADGPPSARARQIKQDIDLACLEVQKQLKQADPQSPFLADVDAILSETARLIQQEPVVPTSIRTTGRRSGLACEFYPSAPPPTARFASTPSRSKSPPRWGTTRRRQTDYRPYPTRPARTLGDAG